MSERDALERIIALLSGDRATVNPSNAWEHWQVANKTLVEVRTIARQALLTVKTPQRTSSRTSPFEP